nr:MAG TPA: hypothetical protein [Caudoviricetes sp.]
MYSLLIKRVVDNNIIVTCTLSINLLLIVHI